ncbi:MAG: nucleotidyltransferase family protein [Calditrichaeota bacterium]|nr:MAG: nucleotidyltransferase family protein [Calditrichota bacterium]
MLSRPFVSAVLLAAGQSHRMQGEDKLSLKIGDKTLFQWSLHHVLGSRVDEILVVTSKSQEPIQATDQTSRVRVLHNPDAASGMSSSLKTGLRAVSPRSHAAIVLLADQPLLRAQTIDRFLTVFARGDKKIVAASYGGTVGSPALFHRDLFPEILAIQGDRGARSVIRRFPAELATVSIPEQETVDVDTPEDFARLKKLLAR